MGLMTHSMVSHTWSIKGKKRAEGGFNGLYWTQLGSITETFLSDL